MRLRHRRSCKCPRCAMRRLARLELDIDTRTLELWSEDNMEEFEPRQMRLLACMIRTAYALGYQDAFTEQPDQSGSLFKDNGYPLPKREGR